MSPVNKDSDPGLGAQEPLAGDEAEMAAVLAILHRDNGLDFSHYKPTTLLRRVQRRLGFCQIGSLDDYLAILERNALERDALANDLLIGVTDFFRDAEAFQHLASTVLPAMLHERSPRDDLRIWSAGCATGEEAYSLAILTMEAAEAVGFSGAIKVFATDIQQASLDVAARGVYRTEALARLPETMRQRWFTPDVDHWRVVPELRRNVVVARHNLLTDPPFTRIDLLSCRNLLIYLRPEAQSHALAQFHFALKPGGVLLLGSSETVGGMEGVQFVSLERGCRLFGRQAAISRSRPALPSHPPSLRLAGGAGADCLLRDYDELLKRHMPPSLLIDNERRALHWFGDLSPFLGAPQGRAGKDVLHVLHEPLRSALGVALHQSAETRGRVFAESIPLVVDGEERQVSMCVDCIADDRSHADHFHVLFQMEAMPTSADGHAQGAKELQSMRERLHQTILELQASNECLDLANEELTASNEELQSTNEELKSLNEDLYHLNAELEQRNTDLVHLNRDYDNLLASTEIGTVFLDSRLNIRRFSPAVTAFLKLLPQDIGRPIAHIAYTLAPQNQLLADLEAVLANGLRIERELDVDGRHYLERVLPFRDEHGRQDGVVLTYTDVTAVHAVEAERLLLQNILDALPDGVCIISENHEIEYINPVLEQEFGPLEGQKCHTYFRGQDGPCEWCRSNQVREGPTHSEWAASNGRIYDIFETPFTQPGSQSLSKLGIFHDITERKAAFGELSRVEARQRSILAVMSEGVILWDKAAQVLMANAAAERLTGLPPEKMSLGCSQAGVIIDESGNLLPPADFPVRQVLDTGQHVEGTVLGLRGPEKTMWLQMNAEPVFEAGELVGVVSSFADISRLKEIEASLERSRDDYLSILENFPAMIWRSNLRGRYDYFNAAWLEFTGRSLAEEHALGEDWTADVHPDDRDACREIYRSRFAAQEPFVTEYRLKRSDGQYRWLLDMGRPYRDNAGNLLGYMGIALDVTDRRQAEDRLRLASRVFEACGEGIIITDARERILEVNRAFTEITGYPASEIIGRRPAFLASGRHAPDFYRQMQEGLRERGYWSGEIWNRRKDGGIYPEWLGISQIRDASGKVIHYLGIFSDITERKVSEARIEYMAHHDDLTGLPNRMLFREHFEAAATYVRKSGHKAALLMIDLDRFKAINDSLGHALGDELLRAVAKRLCEAVRDTDTVSRQGGDEFLVMLTGLPGVDGISQTVRKILESTARHFIIQQQEINTSLSIGIAVCPDDGDDFDSLLKMAEAAMYHAKEAGRNTYRFFDPRMNADAITRLHTTNGLRHALTRDEFRLHYQPQIDVSNGQVTGVEALIRWQHPEHGLVPPNRFIALAEESGLIVPIGEWVLNEACRQAAEWQRAGQQEMTVAVNLSAIQFRRGDIEQTVMNALARSGLDPQWLELELTESLLLTDTEHMLSTVHRLKALGVKLSIDDFGTGYSSLAYLKRFDVDRLKIDQSFVRDMATDPDAASIVRAIIQMARSLNLATVSEGVEDERLLDYLRIFHCDEAQGFLFAHPMPAHEFSLWLCARLKL